MFSVYVQYAFLVSFLIVCLMFLYDSTSLVTLWSFILLSNLFHFRISFYLSGDPFFVFVLLMSFVGTVLSIAFRTFSLKFIQISPEAS
jgi:hypothetical protein